MQIEVILKDGSKLYPIYDPSNYTREGLAKFYRERYNEGAILGWAFTN
jgi:hypothetical protein